jgi:hypothetical protein
LWINNVKGEDKWKVVESFIDRAACLAHFRQHSLDTIGVSTGHYWKCFPDTVDPRGPKGK